jgi:hypothetical protein
VLEVGEIGLLALKMQKNIIIFISIATIIKSQIHPCEAFFFPFSRPKFYSELALDWINLTAFGNGQARQFMQSHSSKVSS